MLPASTRGKSTSCYTCRFNRSPYTARIRLKILHVYRTYFPDTQGGLEEAIRQTALATTARGVDNIILSLSQRPHPAMLTHPEGRVFRSRRHLSFASCDMGFGLLKEFRRLARQVDLIQFHFPWPFGDLINLLGNPGKPYVITYHSDIVRQRLLGKLYYPLMHHFLKKAAAIVPTSPQYLETSTVLSAYRQHCGVIPLGLDEAFYPVVDDDLLKRMQTRYGGGFFLFVGVLRYYKGLQFLLPALKDADYRLILVGDGPERARLETQARDLELDNVEFTGFVSDAEKMALIRLSRAMVFPSHLRSEAFGVSLLEAAMMGRPMISTEVGTGTSYVNKHGETGVVVQPASVGELRQGMDILTDDNLALKLGRAARRRFEGYFSAGMVGSAYCDLYESILTGKAEHE